MSSAAKRRSNLKSGGTDKALSNERDATPVQQQQEMLSQANEQLGGASSMDIADDVARAGVDFEDNIVYESYMIKPSNLKNIWQTFKVKKAMFEFMQWYFRPKNSYEPERVDYNALNILAEYQTFNLEYLKNELDLSDE